MSQAPLFNKAALFHREECFSFPPRKIRPRVCVAAHGNSLHALTKYIEQISDEDIMNVEMATGQPVVYDLDDKLNIVSKEKL